MQQNNMDFSGAAKLLSSPEGRRLLALLQREGGETLQKAMALAAAGKTEEAKNLMRPLMESGEAARLLDQLNGRR